MTIKQAAKAYRDLIKPFRGKEVPQRIADQVRVLVRKFEAEAIDDPKNATVDVEALVDELNDAMIAEAEALGMA
jgi:hypothetical protein